MKTAFHLPKGTLWGNFFKKNLKKDECYDGKFSDCCCHNWFYALRGAFWAKTFLLNYAGNTIIFGPWAKNARLSLTNLFSMWPEEHSHHFFLQELKEIYFFEQKKVGCWCYNWNLHFYRNILSQKNFRWKTFEKCNFFRAVGEKKSLKTLIQLFSDFEQKIWVMLSKLHFTCPEV